ncbi:TPA: mechanosensitive channel MscK, partial [Haemophilus influenzae]
MKIPPFFTALFASAMFTLSVSQGVLAANSTNVLPTEQSLKADLANAQKMSEGEAKNRLLAELQTSIDLLQQIQAQQKINDALQTTLSHSESEIRKNNAEIQALKKQQETATSTDDNAQSQDYLQNSLTKLNDQLQDTQNALSTANAQLAGQSSISERAQAALTENVVRTQQINQQLANNDIGSILRKQYQIELQLIDLKNSYNQNLLKNNDQLSLLYQSRYDLLNLRLQIQQQNIIAIQEVINQKNLQQSQNQVEQAQQQQKTVQNDYIQKELDRNAQLGQYLLKQTEKANSLTQDELRMRNILDSLTQTQRTIDEQISALQGTLVLSRIIQQQKQKLPTNLNIQGLSKQIADLRVHIFDITQKRN